jgi:hypothetical protein
MTFIIITFDDDGNDDNIFIFYSEFNNTRRLTRKTTWGVAERPWFGQFSIFGHFISEEVYSTLLHPIVRF